MGRVALLVGSWNLPSSRSKEGEDSPRSDALYGVYVYLCSNSLRRASCILDPIIERSHEAIRQWVQRLAPVCDKLVIDRRRVRRIFVDETMIRIRGRQAWIWVAYEPRLRMFLSFRISYNQSVLDAYLFLRELRGRYGLKPIWTDEATFYPDACRWARLEHHVYPVEWKNQIERMNQALKDRLECFDDLFPCLKEGCDREHANNWIRVFRFYHNNRITIQDDDTTPEHQRFIQTLMETLT
jgi:putative transposase